MKGVCYPPVHHMWRFARDLCEGAYLKRFFYCEKMTENKQKEQMKKEQNKL